MELIIGFVGFCVLILLMILFLLVNRSWYNRSIEVDHIWRDLIRKNNNEVFNDFDKRLSVIEDRINVIEHKLNTEDGDESNDSSMQNGELSAQ